jgi:hypothetical protein
MHPPVPDKNNSLLGPGNGFTSNTCGAHSKATAKVNVIDYSESCAHDRDRRSKGERVAITDSRFASDDYRCVSPNFKYRKPNGHW